MKHNWTRGMELPICIVCGLSPTSAHLWGDDDWKRYAMPSCPGVRISSEEFDELYQREPPPELVAQIRKLADGYEAWIETIWPTYIRKGYGLDDNGKGFR
jgi:hypothetical protein